jgi:hypothetical protein
MRKFSYFSAASAWKMTQTSLFYGLALLNEIKPALRQRMVQTGCDEFARAELQGNVHKVLSDEP